MHYPSNMAAKPTRKTQKAEIISLDVIERRILALRGHRVMLDRDLATLYGVETRTLNQAVKRNLERFPSDFMFRLTPKEATAHVPSRSQSVILKRGQNVKHLPYVFTEHGAAAGEATDEARGQGRQARSRTQTGLPDTARNSGATQPTQAGHRIPHPLNLSRHSFEQK
jgi:hypothetical protein